MAGNVAERLEALGIVLPEPAPPVASYVGFVRQDSLILVSGQLPLAKGVLARKGLLGRDVTLEQGVEAARLCAINILAQVRLACNGDFDDVRCLRLGGFVASTPEFADHPRVINGASDLIVDVFGEKGRHARAAIGVAALPMNACVEVDGIFVLV
jgi:enamine deaminase RidA (YjgF/YER057c/UK114 family)